MLAGRELGCVEFNALDLHPDDSIYADPPYDVEFTAYSPGGLLWAQQERLTRWLAAHPGPVVASNQATPQVLELYSSLGFTIEVLDAPRMIACNGDRAPARDAGAQAGLRRAVATAAVSARARARRC